MLRQVLKRVPGLRRIARTEGLRHALTRTVTWTGDARHGIDSREDTMTPALTTEYRGYFPLSYGALARIGQQMALGPDDVLYDVGCGKGRALCMFARQNLRACVGIEIDPVLAGIARANAVRMRGRRTPVVIHECNATVADYADATVFLLYNPFGPATLARWLARVQAALATQPRDIRIIYAHPVHEAVLADSGWLRRVAGFPVSFQVLWTLQVSIWQGGGAAVPNLRPTEVPPIHHEPRPPPAMQQRVDSPPASMRGGLGSEPCEVRRAIRQRLLSFGRYCDVVIQRGVDVALPDLARQFIQNLDTVAVWVADIGAMRHAVLDAPLEGDAVALQEGELLQPCLAVRHGDRDVRDRTGFRDTRQARGLDERYVVVVQSAVALAAVEADRATVTDPYAGRPRAALPRYSSRCSRRPSR